jgi:hypothetical protein
VAGCCDSGIEPSGSCTTELVKSKHNKSSCTSVEVLNHTYILRPGAA